MANRQTLYMQEYSLSDIKPESNLAGDIDVINRTSYQPSDNQNTKNATADASFHKSIHPRIQVLRISALAKSRTGIQGITPPYCPSGPSLIRPSTDTELEEPPRQRNRQPSPLSNLALSQYTTSVNIRRGRMPHAVNMPQSGFQAVILCGPGIGLSTFTSVPSEFPKALVEVANRPMVWYVLDWCYRMGVTDITLVTPPASKDVLAAALAQNPYLTSLPSPTPDLLVPNGLEHTTPTAELLRLPEVQNAIKSDFLLLPCDLICDISGENFLETYLTSLGGLGGAGTINGSDFDKSRPEIIGFGGERSGRRGGLSIWYNTANREESVKHEECDFMCTAKLDSQHSSPVTALKSNNKPNATMRKLVWTMPMSELWDQCEEDKSWKIRQSLLRKHGNIKCLTQFRDSHIYLFPYWVKRFANLNDDFESVSEDLVGTWAKSEWRKPEYRTRFGARKLFAASSKPDSRQQQKERPIEEEIDLLSLSSTQITRQAPASQPTKPGVQFASRVQSGLDNNILSPDAHSDEGDDETDNTASSTPVPLFPPILSYILPSEPTAPLVRRVDTTPLLLSVSLLLAKTPSIEEANTLRTTTPTSSTSPMSPFSHPTKVAGTTTIAPRVTISRTDTLIDANSTVGTQCVIKSSVIGAGVAIGMGTRITNCVIMSGATIGEKCVLTGTVVGKKAKVGNKCSLTNCEVQDGNRVVDGTEGKGEKYLIGGLEDEVDDDGEGGLGFDGDNDDEAEGATEDEVDGDA